MAIGKSSTSDSDSVRPRPWPLIVLAMLGLFSVSWMLAACDNDDDPDDGPNEATATETEGASPSGSAIPDGEQVLGGGAEEYAKQLFAAWESDDTATIERLATAEAAQVLADRPWAEADGWEFEDCTVSDNAYCTWNGAEATLGMVVDSEMAYQEEDGAVAEIQFTAPGSATGTGEVPVGAQAYAEALFEAWEAHDDARIDQLAAMEAAVVLKSRDWLESDGWQMGECSEADVTFSCTWSSDNGEELEITVELEPAEAGEEQAVEEAQFRGF